MERRGAAMAMSTNRNINDTFATYAAGLYASCAFALRLVLCGGMSAEEIANAFAGHYYNTMDSNVTGLANLYKDTSMVTFEGQNYLGTANVIPKFQAVGSMQHHVSKIDSQPSLDPNNIIVLVAGHLKLDGQENPLQFSEFFQLVAYAPGQFYIHNQIFRLIYT